MKASFLLLALALLAPSASAHDARSSSVDVKVVGPLATVHISVTQAGLHAALEAAAGHTIDARGDGYQALVADHFRNTLHLSANGEPLAVGDVGLRLGNHQSDVRLVVDLPEDARELTLSVESFDGIEGQQTVVRVRHDDEMTRAVFSAETGRTLTVQLTESPPEESPPEESAPEASGAHIADAGTTPPDASGAPRTGWAVGLGLVGLAVVLPLLIVAVRRSSGD